MVYNETGKFKRDKVLRKNKPSTQVRVTGLSVNSQFEDGEEITVLRKTDFTEMENRLQTLENQLKEANMKIASLENSTPEFTTESPKYTNKVIELQDLINNRNGLLMETQNTINNIVLNITNQYNQLGTEVSTANTTTRDNIIELIRELQTVTSEAILYCNEIENQVKGINSQVDNIGFLKWIRSKNKFKIVLDTDKLKQLERHLLNIKNIEPITKADEVLTPMELPNNLLDELTTEDLDLNKLYIGTSENTENNEDIPTKKVG